MKDKLTVFVDRMKKLGIDIKLAGNYPWIYIYEINGKHVTEKFEANHGFAIAFAPIKDGQELKFTDIGEIFNLVRKYEEIVKDFFNTDPSELYDKFNIILNGCNDDDFKVGRILGERIGSEMLYKGEIIKIFLTTFHKFIITNGTKKSANEFNAVFLPKIRELRIKEL